MDFIVSIFDWISGAGASVMMPIIIALLGIIMGAGVGKSVRGGLMVGVGLLGLGLATGLMGTMADAVAAMSARFGLTLSTIDVGWPAAAAIAMATKVGALIIPLCLFVNIIMIVVGATQTVDIDIWNYWHFAFTGSLIACVTGSLPLGLVAAVCNEVIILVLGDLTAPDLETTLGMPGVSLPHGFTAAFVPFALLLNWVIEKIPGLKDVDFSLEGLQEKIGVFGEPVIVGFVLGLVIAILGGYEVRAALSCAVTLAATMVLIPRMASLLMEGLMPISDAAGEFIDKNFKGKGKLYIGLDSAVGVGHPMTIALGLICVPILVFLAVILPGNTVLPAVDLAVLPYVFVLVLPICKGNGFRSLIVGLICCVLGLYIATDLAAPITSVAASIGFDMGGATSISSICDGANPLTWVLYKLGGFGTLSMVIFAAIAIACAVYNWLRIKKINAAE
ncbi:MAG: PTS sugar transporter subunit IIC [Erysipelotrichaceae bacterium]|nr:PTS sugar transporter subunit IIC [Erysipelotrichaceae bacterium]